MSKLEDYQNKYKDIKFERRNGILQVSIHRNGGPAVWGVKAGLHEQLGNAFYDIGRDVENRVVILTGTGDAFLASFDMEEFAAGVTKMTPQFWDRIYKEGKDLLHNLLDIEVPIIGAVNGPALIHAELVVMSDIVLASDKAVFADAAHSPGGTVPGDGVHIWWPMLIGQNRGRYFLLTGQRIDAAEALNLGIVSEVLPHDKLLERAWELAEQLAQKPTLMLRYTRAALTQHIKRRMLDDLGYGLQLEGLASLSRGAED